MAAYEVVLDKFTGPLDLLLHLIRSQELSIHDIPIAAVTDQYLSYLKAMEELSLELASEFVVMAAWLLAIKSRMLLPRPAPLPDDVEEIADPRQELVAQLLEYERFRSAALHLEDRQSAGAFMAGRAPVDLEPYRRQTSPPVEGVSMWDLVDAYRKVLKRFPAEQPVAQIKGHVWTVTEMMEMLVGKLRQAPMLTFRRLLDVACSRAALVTTFLALLELVKDHRVICSQVSPTDDIMVRYVEAMA